MELKFTRTVGHSAQKEFIKKSLESGIFPQNILVSGIPGIGQVPFLLDIGELLLCESTDIRPCRKCRSCLEWQNRSRDNVHFLIPLKEAEQKQKDKLAVAIAKQVSDLLQEPYGFNPSPRQHISIEQARVLTTKEKYAESTRITRIIFILGIECMMEPAANALLKMLEEPPPKTYFLISCENREKILSTILSRCVQLRLPPLSQDDMTLFVEAYAQQHEIPPQKQLIPFCAGSPGTYIDYELHDGVKLFQLAEDFLISSVTQNFYAFSEFINAHSELSNMEQCLKIMELVLEMIRVSLQVKNGLAEYIEHEQILKFTEIIGNVEIDTYIKFLESSMKAVSQYSNPRIALLGNFLQWK
ncbi:MAG: hypothetical protein HQK83_00580 [Fibrobacteria bacterium]|nr:hypothetical protein [Fibrobacteria bacterium]